MCHVHEKQRCHGSTYLLRKGHPQFGSHSPLKLVRLYRMEAGQVFLVRRGATEGTSGRWDQPSLDPPLVQSQSPELSGCEKKEK